MSSPEQCPFCDLDERIIKENEHANLFLSNPRKVKGHTLVTPKRHVEQPWDMTEEELLDVFELVRFAQKALTRAVSEGCDVRQHYRPFMKQGKIKVDHVHYHVIPRDDKDEIYERVEIHDTDLFEELPSEELEEITKIFGADE